MQSLNLLISYRYFLFKVSEMRFNFSLSFGNYLILISEVFTSLIWSSNVFSPFLHLFVEFFFCDGSSWPVTGSLVIVILLVILHDITDVIVLLAQGMRHLEILFCTFKNICLLVRKVHLSDVLNNFILRRHVNLSQDFV
jgi:hypothetical protein